MLEKMQQLPLINLNGFRWKRAVTKLQNSLFLFREIENPGAFIKWETGSENKWMQSSKLKQVTETASFIVGSWKLTTLVSYAFGKIFWSNNNNEYMNKTYSFTK